MASICSLTKAFMHTVNMNFYTIISLKGVLFIFNQHAEYVKCDGHGGWSHGCEKARKDHCGDSATERRLRKWICHANSERAPVPDSVPMIRTNTLKGPWEGDCHQNAIKTLQKDSLLALFKNGQVSEHYNNIHISSSTWEWRGGNRTNQHSAW